MKKPLLKQKRNGTLNIQSILNIVLLLIVVSTLLYAIIHSFYYSSPTNTSKNYTKLTNSQLPNTVTVTPTITEPETTVVPAPGTRINGNKAIIKTWEQDKKIEFTFTSLPKNTRIYHYPVSNKFAPWESIGLELNGSTFMLLTMPYEMFEAPLNTIVPLNSASFGKIFRITSAETLASSTFKVGYTDSYKSVKQMNDLHLSEEKWTTPGGYPSVQFTSSVKWANSFTALCSTNKTFIEMCDSVMNTIKVRIL